MRCRCVLPVQVYDEDLRGVYAVGMVIDGDAALELVSRYPDYFTECE